MTDFTCDPVVLVIVLTVGVAVGFLFGTILVNAVAAHHDRKMFDPDTGKFIGLDRRAKP